MRPLASPATDAAQLVDSLPPIFLECVFAGIAILALCWLVFPWIVIFKFNHLIRLNREMLKELERIAMNRPR